MIFLASRALAARSLLSAGFALTALAALAAACGSTVNDDRSGGTSTGSGGSGATGTTGSGAGGSGIGGDGPSCDAFLPDTGLGDPVTIRIENADVVDIFLGEPGSGCGSPHLYSLEMPNGDPPAIYKGSLEVCELTCAELQQSGCECAADCAQPYVVRIAPGGHYDATWIGYVYDTADMPAACYSDATCKGAGSYCPIERVAPPALDVLVPAYPGATCDGTPCTCTPDATGSCLAFAGTVELESGPIGTTGQGSWQTGEAVVTVSIVLE